MKTNAGLSRTETAAYASPRAQTARSGPERWVDDHGDYLFKFAMTRLRDPDRAEDAVQETFLAALKGLSTFAGHSAEKTWLVGILKNKIYDYFRKACREKTFTDLQNGSSPEDDRSLFDAAGGSWTRAAAPQEWTNPGLSLDSALFWRTYQDCVGRLPKKMAAAFNLREVDGLESGEICALLDISQANLWVMLHRARMALRRSLETNWFAREYAEAFLPDDQENANATTPGRKRAPTRDARRLGAPGGRR